MYKLLVEITILAVAIFEHTYGRIVLVLLDDPKLSSPPIVAQAAYLNIVNLSSQRSRPWCLMVPHRCI